MSRKAMFCLLKRQVKLQKKHLKDKASHDFYLELDMLSLDYRHQHINPIIVNHLIKLANACELKKHIDEMFSGKCVNLSQNQPVLHIALRADQTQPIYIGGKNILDDIEDTHEKMQLVSELIRQKKWLGSTGSPIKDIINIGMGGSDLGPHFFMTALQEFITPDLSFHFISDADPLSFEKTVKNLNPETTLFIIASKSFSTEETLLNFTKASQWIGAKKEQHFIAITEKTQKARELDVKHIIPIWSWVGGRYSVCSAINLITLIAIGWENFKQILAGAHKVDQHFIETEFQFNIPVMLGLIGIWNNNFLNINNLLILNYSNYLELFTNYVQQLDMESNGKSIDNKGKKTPYPTAPIVWGGLGNRAQHSYYQWICQSQHKTTIDFITIENKRHRLMNTYCNKTEKILSEDLSIRTQFNLNQIPINHIRLKKCSPYTIGMLCTLYEHKIFTQGVIWNINPFDQPGIEILKKIIYKN